MEVKKDGEGFAIYNPSYRDAKAALHAAFVAGECRCTVSFFDGPRTALIDVPFERGLSALQSAGFPQPEPGHGC